MLQKAEETQVVKYSVVEADIANMRSIYMDLVITDLDDKEQFNQVKEARLVVKGKRCAVENERKALKKNALEWGRQVDGKAKEIFELLEPIESHLMTEENKVVEEQKRIEREEEERQRKINQRRVDDLLTVEVVMPYLEVATMTDDEFQCLLGDKTFEFEERQKAKAEAEAAEKKRLEKEAADRKAEDERLAKQKAEQEAKAAELQKQTDALAAQQKAIDDERARIAKAEADKKAAEEAEIQAKKDAEDLAKHQAQEAAEAEEKAKIEAERQESLKPDKEKINTWLQNIIDTAENYPKVKDEEAAQWVGYTLLGIENYIQTFKVQAKEL